MAERIKQDKTVIFLMGGGLVNDAGVWRTTNYDEGDNFGVSGDRLRVIAAGLLYKDKPGQLIIASGGKGQLKNILPGKITVASVIKDELIKIGIPAKNIIKEEKSGNTYQQLKELNKLLKKRNLKNIIIISNQYHLSRVKTMIKYAGGLRLLKKRLVLSRIKMKSAESLVIKYEPRLWRKIINDVYKSEAMKKRIKLERQGIKQIKKGVYRLI